MTNLFIIFFIDEPSELFVSERKVFRIKVMNTDKTVFTARGEAFTGRVECKGIDGTKVTLYTANFLRIYAVEKAHFEFTGTSRSRCNFTGILTTTENNLYG